MREIPLTRGLVAIVDDADYEELSRYRWYANRETKTYYARRHGPKVNGKQKTIVMHRQIMDAKDGEAFDHVNGDGLDNRRANLRPANDSQNQANRVRLVTNKSGRRGVCWNRTCGRWQASIGKGGVKLYLGLFDDLDEAAKAYDSAARRIYGEFARPNFEMAR